MSSIITPMLRLITATVIGRSIIFSRAVARGPGGLSEPRFAIWFDISDRLIGRWLDSLVAQNHWTASLDGFTNAVGVR
jgi:hypothetical protein